MRYAESTARKASSPGARKRVTVALVKTESDNPIHERRVKS